MPIDFLNLIYSTPPRRDLDGDQVAVKEESKNHRLWTTFRGDVRFHFSLVSYVSIDVVIHNNNCARIQTRDDGGTCKDVCRATSLIVHSLFNYGGGVKKRKRKNDIGLGF